MLPIKADRLGDTESSVIYAIFKKLLFMKYHMVARFKTIDRDTPMVLPPDLREWVLDDHIAHFILDAVSVLNMSTFKVNHRGTGDEQFPPDMLLALLIYCYSTGRFSSRVIEGATHLDVAVRLISGNTHPDHDTICRFRRVNGLAFRECFVKVLAMASELGHLKKLGNISVDGTKIKADASKHPAVSYKRADEMIEQLELEVGRLEKMAEEADTSNEDSGLNVPEELARRKSRLEKVNTEWSLVTLAYNFRRLYILTAACGN